MVNKKKSFDPSFDGDFNLKNDLIGRKDKNNLEYIYTGLQIIRPEVFSDINKKVFSISHSLYGMRAVANFGNGTTVDTLSFLPNALANSIPSP